MRHLAYLRMVLARRFFMIFRTCTFTMLSSMLSSYAMGLVRPIFDSAILLSN